MFLIWRRRRATLGELLVRNADQAIKQLMRVKFCGHDSQHHGPETVRMIAGIQEKVRADLLLLYKED
jgi:hypothetical protein